jgi:hypothetical protein
MREEKYPCKDVLKFSFIECSMIVKAKMSKTPRPMISSKTAYNPIQPGKRLKGNHNAVFHLQSLSTRDIIPVLNRHTLSHVVNLVDADKSGSKLELENMLAMSTWK